VALTLFVLPASAALTHGREALRAAVFGYSADLALPWVPRQHVNFGVYDPGGQFELPLAIQHVFIRWDANAPGDLALALASAARQGRWPLVTVEPWPRQSDALAIGRLFPDIVDGRYDGAIAAICRDIATFAKPVFVRWGHEMEYVTGRYPWAQADAAGYIRAYRHFVDTCRGVTDNVFYVWSPAGNRELSNYWPGTVDGPQYADYVGLSVYAYPDADVAEYGTVRSFDEIFAEKYRRVEGFRRPVMITELGVTGGSAHQRAWMQDALESFNRYPLLKSVVYFNAVDSRLAWSPALKVPNWQIDPEVFR
jgi:cellulose synthase (UDP-forming)